MRAICRNCKHSIIKSFKSNYSWDYYCGLHYEVNSVTGEYEFDRCKEYNEKGECQLYEASVLTRIKSCLGL